MRPSSPFPGIWADRWPLGATTGAAAAAAAQRRSAVAAACRRRVGEEEVGCSDKRRFELELEFVHCLANPGYLNCECSRA